VRTRQIARGAVLRSRNRTSSSPWTCSARSRSQQRVDGWVSLEVSPLLWATAAARRCQGAVRARGAAEPHDQDPGALETYRDRGDLWHSINVTLLFSQAMPGAAGVPSGIERRMDGAQSDGDVGRPIFVSRWDTAVADKVLVPAQ
jgi:hypothetical protein